VKIRFLYTEGCPSHEEALERLQKALAVESVEADIEITRVETFDEAEREHYPGSPTILINGRDICPTQSSHYAPTCRAYVLEDGRISPLPSLLMMRKAIRDARKNLKEA
jgi:hypothetical protein